MTPILFNSKATTFTTNGIGRLADCTSCVVREERNGPYECELTYPITGVHYSDLQLSNIVVVKPSPHQTLQAFRIYRISRPIGGTVTAYLRHISYQLSFIPFKPFSAQSLAAALTGFKTNALEPCPFTLTADFTSSSSFAVPLPASIRSYLGGREGSIIDVYGNGAEWEWDNYNCKLHANRGADRGVVLRYGKNIIDLKQEQNIENTITGVLSYWTSETVNVILPSPVESATAANFPFPRTVVLDFTDKWDNAPTQAQLLAATESYIRQNGVGIPKVNIELSFLNLADTVEYKDFAPAEQISLCDTITVEFVKLGVSAKAKIVKTEYDVLLERYNKINIGDARTSLSDTIEEQMQLIAQRPTVDQTKTNIDRATGVLNSGLRGHVIINRNAEGWANEILFLDDENVARAKNVLRINTNGIGFSSTGYNGPFYQSWTIDGHFALGGVNNAYGDFEILDSSGKALGQWNKDGLMFFDSAQKLLLKVNHGGLYLYNAAGKTLAQLTPNGLNVYEGSIEGGSININNKFKVDKNGKMTAVDGTFSGAITGGTININNAFKVDAQGNLNAKFTGGSIQIGQNFKVDSNGKMTASAATFNGAITGGSIKIGNKFEVKNDGKMIASGAEFGGDIKAGTIKIGQKFEVKNDGTMSATGATFTGDITGSNITGSSFKTGDKNHTFEADADHVKLGPFYAYEYSGHLYFSTDDGKLGFGDNDGWLIWENWNGDIDFDHDDPGEVFGHFGFGVHNENVYCSDVYCEASAFWGRESGRWWSLNECLEWVYDELDAANGRIAALQAAIAALTPSGGGS